MIDDHDALCLETIFSRGAEEYGSSYHQHVLNQYHGYVESVQWVGELKQKVNSYFLTMNTILLTALGVSFANIIDVPIVFQNGAWRIVLPFIGAVISLIWWAIIHSYSERTAMKLHIIHCIEQELPLAPYSTESVLIRARYPGAKYYFFKMSLVIPWIFVVLYVLLVFLA